MLSITELIVAASNHAKSRCWYISPSYKQSEMIAWKLLQDMLPREMVAKKNEVKLEIILINGSEISLKGADNPDSLRGAGLNFAVLDEYASMKANVWEEVIRPTLVDTKGSVLFISTPKGKNSFYDLWCKGQRGEEGYTSYTYKTIDNPLIDPKEIEDAKSQSSDVYFRQEYEASFEDYRGLIWPEFNHKDHVIEPISIPDYWESLGSIDTALTGTTAALYARVDDYGNVYIVGEYYEQNKRVSEVSSVIKGNAKRWLIDPASKGQKSINREGKLYSLYDEYCEYGVYPTAAENDVDSGINRVAEFLKQKKVKIFSTCKNLIYEMERYHWAEEKETTLGISKPKPFKLGDHNCDNLRYIIASRSSPAQYIKPLPPEKSLAGYQRRWEFEENSKAKSFV